MTSQIYKTCLELTKQRGYEIVEEQEDLISSVKPDGETFYVFINGLNQFNVSSLFHYVNIMKELNTKHILVVYRDKITTKAQQTVDLMADTPITYKKLAYPPMKIELFAEEDLKYNITKHRLQPKFELLDDNSATEFKKNWSKYGTMKVSEPIARFYNYKRGNVVRITRHNGIIYYRIVK